MASEKLTNKFIVNLRPSNGQQIEIYDLAERGLTFRASPGGTKSFYLNYRIGQTKRRLKLGVYPDLSLANARKAAQVAKAEIAQGGDPQADRHKERHDVSAGKFSDTISDYVEHYATRNTKSWRETERILKYQFIPAWSEMPLAEITKGMVQSRLRKIGQESGPSAANHGLAIIRAFFNWSVEQELVQSSPCTGVKMPYKTKARERVLADEELAHLVKAVGSMSYPLNAFVMLLITTGQRRSSVARMRWRDIDFGKCLWTQPAEDNKSGRKHEVPLSKLAIEVLRRVPVLDKVLVFPARGREGRSISGYSKWKRKLDEASGITGWTYHDLRRTAATRMAQLKVPKHIIELILDHQNRGATGVEAIYNQYAYLEEQREALEQWAEYVRALTDKSHHDRCFVTP